MPSVKSREQGFYYAHPQNRFWSVLSAVYGVSDLQTAEQKTIFLLKHHIALWDVIASCNIESSSDASIKNAVPNDLSVVFSKADIKAVFTTGTKAFSLYNRFYGGSAFLKPTLLPSTSPANCRITTKKLIKEYSVIKDYTHGNIQNHGGIL